MTIEYRGFAIHCEPPPIPLRQFDWQATLINGDGEPNCYGPTLPQCKAEIDRWHDEQDDGA